MVFSYRCCKSVLLLAAQTGMLAPYDGSIFMTTAVGGDIYMVPDSEGTGYYRVDYANETCTCRDSEFHPELTCKHVFVVGIYLAKRRVRSFVCAGCRERTPLGPGYTVGDDDLTFFEGQRLCEPCAFAHGVA